MPLANTLISDSRRQVGFTAAAGAGQYQPSSGFAGKGQGGLVGVGKLLLIYRVPTPAFGEQGIEGEAS